MITIKEVFGRILKHQKIDNAFAVKIKKFTYAFVSRKENHVTFFGNALIGTPKIAFLPADREEWFEEILEIDESTLKQEVATITEVNTDFNVTGNSFNLSIVYLLHAFTISKHCSKKRSYEARKSLLMLLHYKFLTSLVNNSFPHEADRGTAIATYASLNKRFSLKVHGSWNALLAARADDVLSDDSIHKDTLLKFDDDTAVIYILSDTQTRIRDIVNIIVGKFHEMHDNDRRILSSQTLSTFDGEEKLADKQDKFTQNREALLHSVREKNNFIREEVLEIVTGMMSTLPPRLLREALEYISDNYGNRKAEYLDELLNETAIHAMAYIRNNPEFGARLKKIIPGIRSIYMSSKSKSDELVNIRELADRVVESSVSSKNDTVKAACRTGVLLYITLRMLVSSKYV